MIKSSTRAHYTASSSHMVRVCEVSKLKWRLWRTFCSKLGSLGRVQGPKGQLGYLTTFTKAPSQDVKLDMIDFDFMRRWSDYFQLLVRRSNCYCATLATWSTGANSCRSWYVRKQYLALRATNWLLSWTVSLQILFTITLANVQDDTDATLSAEGSPKPSVAAQSTATQQPIREHEDGRSRIDGERQKLHVE